MVIASNPGVVLVTGAGSGMGLACVGALAERGYFIVAVDRDEDSVQLAVRGLATGVAVAVAADVTKPDQTRHMVRVAVDTFGRLDAAVNAAGVSQRTMAPTADLDEEEWHRVLSINLDGVFLSMRAEIPAILDADGGSIVNFGSTMSVAASSSGIAAYVASKHAVLGLTRSAALEYATRGLRINVIGPGIIDTPMTQVWDAQKRGVQIGKHPADRFGRPEEVAALVAYLISPESTFVTGSFYAIDGGFGAQ
jgi:NAD(P)-dependent dehydrogenase (short-subunit alcohol dehydrogenase family)